MDINEYQGRQYSAQPCWELVADVLANELNILPPVAYKTINRSVREMADAFRVAIHNSAHGFVQVDTPSDYAIVLMAKRPTTGIHHCGIYYGGKVLHAQGEGTWYEDLPTLRGKFSVIEFWQQAA